MTRSSSAMTDAFEAEGDGPEARTCCGSESRAPSASLFSAPAILPRSLAVARRWAQGKKTYAAGAAILFLLLGQWSGWWNLPPQVYLGLLALAQMFLRRALARAEKAAEPSDPPSNPNMTTK